jgi:hypothetical protein
VLVRVARPIGARGLFVVWPRPSLHRQRSSVLGEEHFFPGIIMTTIHARSWLQSGCVGIKCCRRGLRGHTLDRRG